MGDDSPKYSASQGEGEYEAVVDPIHRCVAGIAGMPVGGDAGDMEEVLADKLGEMIEGPVELVLDPSADDWEDIQKRSVIAQDDEAKEVEEGDAESEADSWAPRSGRSRGNDRRGRFSGSGDAWKLQWDLAWGGSGSWTILVQAW